MNDIAVVLNENENQLIEKALNFVAEKIISKVGNSNYVLIKITDIDFNPCDYQPEGLFCAVIGWASQEFDFAVPNINVEFNKNSNYYSFIDEMLVTN